MQAVKNLSLGGGGRAALVIGLHVVVIYFIATGLGVLKVPKTEQAMEAVMIETPQAAQPVQPAVVKPQLTEPTLDVPAPDTVPLPEIEVPSDMAANAITQSASDAVESTELQVANRVAPAYPPASLSAGEQGVVIFRVLVDEKGHPLEVNVMKSSGFARLDAAAQKAVSRWVFVPPTRDGAAVRSWSRVQVRFELKNA